eukprot:TRINITY_DN73_c0_g1_i2.p1 TRINITY_DN73_c0_g1~~TRINITY_DN73_c0_g1_i2.p1  ORF type:complete len:104 (-),score=34.95 TRINITY_DN73_c0_g1_i2:48-359(-)
MALLRAVVKMAAAAYLVTPSQSLMTPSTSNAQPELQMSPEAVWSQVMGKDANNEIKLSQEADKTEVTKAKSRHQTHHARRQQREKRDERDDENDENGEEEEEE